MDSIFIWLPLVYTTNDQLNLTFVIFIRQIIDLQLLSLIRSYFLCLYENFNYQIFQNLQ